VRCSLQTAVLAGHPALEQIGDPPPDARIINTAYWDQEPLGPGNQRAFQILARVFGLPTPVPEVLYLPGAFEDISWLSGFMPWKERNAVFAVASASPRKTMPLALWQQVVDGLRQAGFFVVQVGKKGDTYVRHAYSLVGATTLREVISLLRCFDVVITCDNFLMHTAHLVGVPAVVLWGPTSHEVYGYAEQRHLQSPSCGCQLQQRVGPRHAEFYHAACPERGRHCMNRFEPGAICTAAVEMARKRPKQGRPEASAC
jgi:ADP-heptose:LPS heptosyltransferase